MEDPEQEEKKGGSLTVILNALSGISC